MGTLREVGVNFQYSPKVKTSDIIDEEKYAEKLYHYTIVYTYK